MSTKPVNGSNPGLAQIPTSPTGADISRVAAPAKPTVANPNVNARNGNNAGGTNVQISADAKNRAEGIQKALEIARATPDVREDRVADLKKRIQDGTYQVDAGKVADGMMREAILEHLTDTDET